ncbi:tyrosine-type recombinase/integrase [uncultured Jannaschia sp.]|uniref:tyrosine-type recombinase/integrase n=1 Tax=uncultured Jannaschia sp. TaxID=293347 RepID=UPI00261056B9|nr:tyrosine-type recombinase/integrase [uncultured Jannaschia sp.]
MPSLFDDNRTYVLGDPELELIGDRNKLAQWRHEGNPMVPVRVVKFPSPSGPKIHLRNDRIIHRWQGYAGRYDPKTQDRHLAAIRFMEELTDGKAFACLACDNVNGVREALRCSLGAAGDARRSRSTVSHMLSHLRAFLEWLLKQSEFERLPRDLPGYLELSRKEYAAALPRPSRAYPEIAEAEGMLRAMPKGTRKERRDRALFALAFLGALRADTVVSLRKKHVLRDQRKIVQDASVVRAKNGKSQTIIWFPIPDLFGTVVTAWIVELTELGAIAEDALFPSDSWLNEPRRMAAPDRAPIEPMATKHAVTGAFRIACRSAGTNYTPHAAKHTIAALRDERHLTHEQRKAWSENMGHESEAITERHYGKMSDDRRAALFEEIGKEGQADSTFDQDQRRRVSELLDELNKIVRG